MEPVSFGIYLLSLAGVTLATGSICWLLHRQKMKRAQALAAENEAFLKTQLEHLQARADTQKSEAAAKLQEAASQKAELEKRFAQHQEEAQIREQKAKEQIQGLETNLTAASQRAAQLEPALGRISQLEGLLDAEKGRTAALEQTVSIITQRADDLDGRLKTSQYQLTEHREKTAQREEELLTAMANREKAMAGDLARLAESDATIAGLQETQSSYQQQTDGRISNLQRQLAAAEAKASLVQKEFMNAVGVLPDASTTPAAAKETDRRVHDLENRIIQTEAEARKKAREDGYRIAELEYRLSEASEQAARLKEVEQQAAEAATLRAEKQALEVKLAERNAAPSQVTSPEPPPSQAAG